MPHTVGSFQFISKNYYAVTIDETGTSNYDSYSARVATAERDSSNDNLIIQSRLASS